MKNKAVNLITEYNMIECGESITVGFSGGADSTALLYLLFSLKEQWRLKLSAVHLNHQLRGSESDRDEEFCKELCHRLGITFYHYRMDIKKIALEKKRSIEEVAREERYKLFEKYCGVGKIATAHTLSDSVETTLINLTRGTGIHGLCGIPPVRGHIIRPLLSSTRKDIEQYCAGNNLEYIIDSSNLENIYTRNKIRHQVIPPLEKLNPSFQKLVGNTQRLLSQDSAYLEHTALKALESITTSKGYLVKEFLALSAPIYSRVLMKILQQHNLEANTLRIDLMYNEIIVMNSGLQLSENLVLVCSADYFKVKETTAPSVYKYFEKSFYKKDLLSRKIIVLGNKSVFFRQVDCKEIENIRKNYKEGLKFLLDCDKIAKELKIRGRKNGDRFSPTGRGVNKTFKNLFNEAGLSASQRNKLLVLEAEHKIIWLENFGADQSVSVNNDTRLALEVIIKNIL